jgi:RNA polymerase sigma-70 factor (ECF subfamily)
MSTEVTSAAFDLAGMIRQHQAGVWRYLRVLGCDPAEADDLTQDTFLAVLQKPFSDYNPAATAAYLRKVARNLFLTARRRAVPVVPVAEIEQLDAAWQRWAGDDGGQALLAALEACLQTLAERTRRALDLRFREQMSRSRIASSIGLSEDGAKNLLQRAKQHLRECVERKMQ